MDAVQQVAVHALGIDTMAAHGVQGRGVLVNLYGHFGDSPRPEIGYGALICVLDADEIEVGSYNIIRFYTCLNQLIMAASRTSVCSTPARCCMSGTRSHCNGSPPAASRHSPQTTW